ncbi:MAG: hypothetical protein FRX49_05850 [Trebouxia sp. A1-2]|nr:MAG: hypothetical protein FRX49_05850 [Trebouxia sp. A1-2]
MQQLDAKLKKNVWLLQQLETEHRKSGEAEQLRLSNARTTRQLMRQRFGQMKQANAAFGRWEARSAAATKYWQTQVSALESELDSMSQPAQAEATKLQQQLTGAPAEAKSAAQQIVSLTCQLTAVTHRAETSEEFVKMVLQQQQTDAQAIADALKLYQRLSDAQAEAASGEQMTTLQKELEQLRTSAGQMKADLEEAQQRQIAAQEKGKMETAQPDSRIAISNLKGQLVTAADAHANAASAQSDAKKLQKQLSAAVSSFDPYTRKVQQQLTEAQAAAELAQAGTQKGAASGEKMPKLQKELEQLHTSTGQMTVDLKATQQSQTDIQVVPGGVQQQHAIAQLEQNNQKQLADLIQQPADSGEQ